MVIHEIERRIFAGEMVEGDRFNDTAIAASLGVSRGPVREARRSLEHSGLLTSTPNFGTYVRSVRPAELAETYEVRAVLTGFACAGLARTVSETDLARLRETVEGMEAVADDPERYYAMNVAFHQLLMELAGNDRARAIYADLVRETHIPRRRSFVMPDSMRVSNAEHREILAAIAAGDPERARSVAETHVLAGRDRWMAAEAGGGEGATGPEEAAGPSANRGGGP